MNMGILAGAVALAVSGFASAGFVGMEVTSSVVDGKQVFKVYAKFDNANNTVLNVFGVGAINGSAFFHADFVGTSYAPQFASNAATDTYMLIGGAANFGNTTNADPGWGALGFNQVNVPAGAGWFNSNPPNLQGKVDPVTLRTQIAQFSYAGAILAFSTPITVGFNLGLGTPTTFATSAFTVPAPGAIALLGLAGLAGRRRRS